MRHMPGSVSGPYGGKPAARFDIAALFADGWGPAWQIAAAAGLPPYGPLTLPGIWRIS